MKYSCLFLAKKNLFGCFFDPPEIRYKFQINFSISTSCLLIVFFVFITVSSSAQTHIRYSVNDYFSSKKNLESFKKGIRVMKERSAKNPLDKTGWVVQANLHACIDCKEAKKWVKEGQIDPSWEKWIYDGCNACNKSVMNNLCQHDHWFFLAWHRMYLYYFERILREASGDPSLSLPYWNYTDPSEKFTSLPEYYLSDELFSPDRALNEIGTQLPSTSIDISRAMSTSIFVGTEDENGFGSGSVTGPVQFQKLDGLLEITPHGTVHGSINGKMTVPHFAAQDPIFWAHHSNIDRLWETWNKLDINNQNPVNPKWLDQQFSFYDEKGNTVDIQVKQIIHLEDLGYKYDKLESNTNTSSFAAIVKSASLAKSINRHSEMAMGSNLSFGPKNDTTIKITKGKVEITGAPKTVNAGIENSKPFKSFSMLSEKFDSTGISQNVYLLIEGIEFQKMPKGFIEVYLNLPGANATTNHLIPNYVGNISFFNIPPGKPETKSVMHMHHGDSKSPRDKLFNVTGIVTQLIEADKWNSENVTVTFVVRPPDKNGVPQQTELLSPIKIENVKFIFK
jgi:hypothetical protein